jgi:hypothetical protein
LSDVLRINSVFTKTLIGKFAIFTPQVLGYLSYSSEENRRLSGTTIVGGATIG